VKNHKRKLIENPLRYREGSYFIDFSDLDKKLPMARMMFLCSPHNPTGNVWPPDVLQRVGELCLKHNVLLISDEIHSDLILPGYRHTPTSLISEAIAKNTITCMAPSKTFNLAGLSTAFLVTSNAKLRSRYEDILDQVHVGAGNILGFTATEAAYNYGDEWLIQLMNYIAGNLRFVKDFITTKIPRIKVIEPQATYLVWLDCSGLKMHPDELKQFMIEKAGLGLNDGRVFGIEGEGFHRINIGCPRQVLQTALQKLQIAVDKYFEK
jgi:cystathionine beta-lyase